MDVDNVNAAPEVFENAPPIDYEAIDFAEAQAGALLTHPDKNYVKSRLTELFRDEEFKAGLEQVWEFFMNYALLSPTEPLEPVLKSKQVDVNAVLNYYLQYLEGHDLHAAFTTPKIPPGATLEQVIEMMKEQMAQVEATHHMMLVKACDIGYLVNFLMHQGHFERQSINHYVKVVADELPPRMVRGVMKPVRASTLKQYHRVWRFLYHYPRFLRVSVLTYTEIKNLMASFEEFFVAHPQVGEFWSTLD